MVGQLMTLNTHAISTETLLQLLAHPRRRAVVQYLVENDGKRVHLEELAETIAADSGTARVSHESDTTPIHVELHHTHLPKLASAGIIEYDAERTTVRYLSTERIEILLQFVSTRL